MSVKPFVIYHAYCSDGFTSVWIARRALGEVRFHYSQYGEEPPDLAEVAGRDVYVLDFSYRREVLVEWAKVAKSLLVLDHHKTAEAALKDLPFAKFCEDESACVMTWKHFYKDQPPPPIVEYVNDRDLWQFKLPESRAVNAYIASFAYRFEAWDQIDKELREDFDSVVRAGEALVRMQNQLVGRILRNAEEVVIDGHKVLQANTPILTSEVAGALAKDRPFAAAWFKKNGSRVVSLRSVHPKGMDVSEIARKFGGGGHKHAAGYQEIV